jgi:hypothetical protein
MLKASDYDNIFEAEGLIVWVDVSLGWSGNLTWNSVEAGLGITN